METKTLNFGGDKPITFMLGIERDSKTPSWMAVVDELWMSIVAADLYKAIKSHDFLCIYKNISDPKDFAATMNITSFQSLLFSGETMRFQDMVNALIGFTLQNYISPSPTMYITFMSDYTNSSHAVNCIVEFGKGTIVIGANMNEKLAREI